MFAQNFPSDTCNASFTILQETFLPGFRKSSLNFQEKEFLITSRENFSPQKVLLDMQNVALRNLQCFLPKVSEGIRWTCAKSRKKTIPPKTFFPQRFSSDIWNAGFTRLLGASLPGVEKPPINFREN